MELVGGDPSKLDAIQRISIEEYLLLHRNRIEKMKKAEKAAKKAKSGTRSGNNKVRARRTR